MLGVVARRFNSVKAVNGRALGMGVRFLSNDLDANRTVRNSLEQSTGPRLQELQAQALGKVII
jgi:hypothetical protein